MDNNKSQGMLRGIERPIRQTSEQAPLLPPWLFQHHALADALENAQKVDRKALINTLNFIHFMGRSVLILFKLPNYDESILVRAYPEPSLGEELTCRWSDKDFAGLDPEEYRFQHLIIADGYSMTLIPGVMKELNNTSITIQLPSLSYAVGHRQTRRYDCRNVLAELIQSGFLATGNLLEFSPGGFHVRVKPEKPCSFEWFNSDDFATVQLRKERQLIFSGICRCIREYGGVNEREFVLAPLTEEINRFKNKKVRNPRQNLLPPPTVIFDHPLLEKKLQFAVADISSSGLCVYEKAVESTLVPGLVIPKLTINFADAFEMSCNAQVIYQLRENKDSVRYGLAILNMDMKDYGRLNHILINALDPHFHTSSVVNLDALWEFFFESGFLYPSKYRLIQSYKERFKETYRKIYQESPDIARHFTYEKNGRIYGHICVVRTYVRAWLIQHHSSRAMENKRTGFLVLKQIMHYLNDMYRLPAANMDYAMTYYRPENKIPDRIFGGFTQSLDNARGSSLELFSYLPYTRLSLGARLPDGWVMQRCSAADLWELNRFYTHNGGGLLLEALNLGQELQEGGILEEDYARSGFIRKLDAFSLRCRGELNAVLIAEKSDLGLNLSELLNGIKVLVTKPEKLRWNVLSLAISQLTSDYEMDRVPILFYPLEYVQRENIPYEKQYQLWILNVQYAGKYMEYMQNKFRIRYK